MDNPQLEYLDHVNNLACQKPNKTLMVSTDCSGIEAPIMALNLLRIPYVQLWNSDIDEKVFDSMDANYDQPILGTCNDIMSRDNAQLNRHILKLGCRLDIYIAGFPCQSFSNLGYGQGFDDYKNRGIIFFACLDTIIQTNPTVFILENVKGLVSNNNGATFSTIISSLKKIGKYDIHYGLLNTINYGLPQFRERLYIIGIRKASKIKGKTFKFPEPFKLNITVDDIMRFDDTELTVLTHHKTNIIEDLHKNGKIDNKCNWIVNLNVSNYTRSSPMNNISPCLMAQGAIYYSVRHRRNLTPREFLRLQGFPDSFKQVVSDNQIYRQAGNSMSIPVLMMLYIELFNAVNFDKQ